MAEVTVTVSISAIINVASEVVKLVDEVQRNREKCIVLGEHVRMILLLLTELQRQWTPDAVTNSMLKNLHDVLDDGKGLLESCLEKRTWSLVFRTQRKAKKITALDMQISNILGQFHIANMILIVSVNKERFFMNVLEKLLRDGACRRLQQSEKEELKSSIKNLTNMDNMSSEAKKMLEWIVRDLTQGASSELPGGRQVAPTGDDEVVHLAHSIVQVLEAKKALRQNKEEIQQLVQFVQQVAHLMRQPQSSELARDPETRPMVKALKEHLQEAYRIVLHNQQHRNNSRIAQAFLCGDDGGYTWQQPDHILKVAYTIEYYVQVLPVITRRQMEMHA